MRSKICALTVTSRAETASSKITSLGFMIKARAIAIRCLCPPENSCIYLFLSLAESPTSSKTLSILFSIFLASGEFLMR